MLDYRYKTFLTLIEEGSYTKSRPKISRHYPTSRHQHIQHLQEELGVQLFSYEGKQLLVTEKGRYLEEQLSLLNRDVERIRTHLLQQDDAPTLSFGATLTIGEYVMPGLIGRYLEQHPRHHLSMVVDNTATLTGLIQKGKIDFALIEGDFKQSQRGFQKLSDEPFIGVVRPPARCGAVNRIGGAVQRAPVCPRGRLRFAADSRKCPPERGRETQQFRADARRRWHRPDQAVGGGEPRHCLSLPHLGRKGTGGGDAEGDSDPALRCGASVPCRPSEGLS